LNERQLKRWGSCPDASLLGERLPVPGPSVKQVLSATGTKEMVESTHVVINFPIFAIADAVITGDYGREEFLPDICPRIVTFSCETHGKHFPFFSSENLARCAIEDSLAFGTPSGSHVLLIPDTAVLAYFLAHFEKQGLKNVGRDVVIGPNPRGEFSSISEIMRCCVTGQPTPLRPKKTD
jgi:hypothetical protein